MFFENLALALSSLRANKMRALLTMLGIIIGIASVIAIMTIGSAMTASVNSNLSSLGTRNISVNIRQKSQNSGMGMDMGGMMGMGGMGGGGAPAGGAPGGGAPGGGAPPGGRSASGRNQQSSPKDEDLISADMVAALKEAYPNEIEAVSYAQSGSSAEAKDGSYYANIAITGTNEDYVITNDITMIDGRYISEKDIENYRRVAVVSDKFVNNMFSDGSDPIGEQVKVYTDNSIDLYTIVGIYEYDTTSAFGMNDTSSEEDLTTDFYIPVSTAKLGNQQKNFNNITITVTEDTAPIAFADELQAYFDDLYKRNDTWGANITSMESMVETVTSSLNTIYYAIALIAGISLVVGGIGVMNIMLVSVTERTREIGTRKALGAKNYHVRVQFVTEAVIISIIGGIIGIFLGSGIGGGISVYAMDAPFTLSVVGIAVSFGFSMAIGIFFGYYPANKAAKLDPIEALRYE